MRRAFPLALVLAGCSASMTPTDSMLVGAEQAQQIDCVNRFKPDASAQNECRAQVKGTWDHYWASRDAGGDR